MEASVFYGLHMAEGVAEYREPGKEPLRVYVGEEACKSMDSTFPGKPVFVRHVDEVPEKPDEVKDEADGYVVESFFNKADGKHWAKFVVITQKGLEAIVNNQWKLSNCYIPEKFAGGGQCHGVDYQKEIISARYEHLAIVPDPRYEESIILTPEDFKTYNAEKEVELARVANEKGETKMELKFWNRTAVKNSADLANTVVTLPKTGKEVTIEKLVNEMDSHYEKEESKDPNAPAMANMEDHVKVGDNSMPLHEVMHNYHKMKAALDEHETKQKAADLEAEEKKKKDAADEDGGEAEAEKQKKAADKTENGAQEDGGEAEAEKQKKAADKTENKKKNEEDEAKKKKEEEEKHKNAKLHFEALKNAPNTPIKETAKFELGEDKVKRGQARYGSS